METVLHDIKKVAIGLFYTMGLEILFLLIGAGSVWLILHAVNAALAECHRHSDLLSDPGVQVILASVSWKQQRKCFKKLIGKK